MRTTLTLEDDVAVQLEELRKERDWGLKEAVNSALRQGLSRLREPRAEKRRYQTAAVDLGASKLPSLDDISEVLSVTEGENFR